MSVRYRVDAYGVIGLHVKVDVEELGRWEPARVTRFVKAIGEVIAAVNGASQLEGRAVTPPGEDS